MLFILINFFYFLIVILLIIDLVKFIRFFLYLKIINMIELSYVINLFLIMELFFHYT